MSEHRVIIGVEGERWPVEFDFSKHSIYDSQRWTSGCRRMRPVIRVKNRGTGGKVKEWRNPSDVKVRLISPAGEETELTWGEFRQLERVVRADPGAPLTDEIRALRRAALEPIGEVEALRRAAERCRQEEEESLRRMVREKNDRKLRAAQRASLKADGDRRRADRRERDERLRGDMMFWGSEAREAARRELDFQAAERRRKLGYDE